MKFNIQNFNDLEGQTVFDITNNESVIEEIVDFSPSNKEMKDNYLKSNPLNLAHDIYEYACIVNDKDLRQASLLYSDKLQQEMEEKIKKAERKGTIVD